VSPRCHHPSPPVSPVTTRPPPVTTRHHPSPPVTTRHHLSPGRHRASLAANPLDAWFNIQSGCVQSGYVFWTFVGILCFFARSPDPHMSQRLHGIPDNESLVTDLSRLRLRAPSQVRLQISSSSSTTKLFIPAFPQSLCARVRNHPS
jgi:hypothetical protein